MASISVPLPPNIPIPIKFPPPKKITFTNNESVALILEINNNLQSDIYINGTKCIGQATWVSQVIASNSSFDANICLDTNCNPSNTYLDIEIVSRKVTVLNPIPPVLDP